jgi:hypothetical protein
MLAAKDDLQHGSFTIPSTWQLLRQQAAIAQPQEQALLGAALACGQVAALNRNSTPSS